jgi:endonuclease/exonuclease/phosphatase family metal-dependent hydrolase
MSRFCLCLVAVFGVVAGTQADELPERVTIATWNLEWFFDSYTNDNAFDVPKQQSPPSKEEWEWKLSTTAAAIAKMNPTILCLQEVESRSTVAKLVKRLKEEHKIEYKIAFVEGSDFFTEQDVCVLAQSGLVEYGRREQTKEMYKSKEYYELNKHIFCTFEWGSGKDLVRLTLLNIHQRAQPEQTAIRIRQAKLAHRYLAERIKAGENVVLIGDTNTEYPFEKTEADNDIGILRGLNTPEQDDDLFDCHELLKPEDRPTHIIHKSFDRIFISDPLRQGIPGKKSLVLKSVSNRKDLNTRGKEQDKDHWNIYYQIPQDERDISDHFPIVAEFEVK